ncbi:MAG: hypothetical protein IPP14_15610 [Planctomycetes bacterium]|nr:hypothetical protein [Planctomycetota bacterium]
MAWTELHDTLPDHPKIKYLAAEIGCTKGHAVGVVVSLWCHTLRYGKAGEIRLSYVRGLLADIGETDVDGAICALRFCGWVEDGSSDQTVRCHDWDDYAGRLEMIRERDKLRKQADRVELKRLRGTSNGHPKDVQKSPEESAQPNPTGHNQEDKLQAVVFPPELEQHRDVVEQWLAYKKERREGYKPVGLKAAYSKMVKMGDSLPDALERAMASGWRGFDFPDKSRRDEPVENRPWGV